jgi:hypothetical protein
MERSSPAKELLMDQAMNESGPPGSRSGFTDVHSPTTAGESGGDRHASGDRPISVPCHGDEGLAIDPEGRILLAERPDAAGRQPRLVMIVDVVLDTIEREVSANPPERGGGLLGPIGLPVITAFLPDPHAPPAEVAFRASPAFLRALAAIDNVDSNLELKGILHSRPGTMSCPSGGDTIAFADSLRLAPRLSYYVNPIVTRQYRRPERHELLLPSGIMSVYVSERVTSGRVQAHPAQARVLPIGRDITRLAAVLGGEASPLGTVNVDGMVYVSAAIELGDRELKLLFAPMYPFQPPIALVRRGSGIVPKPISWDLTVPEQARLESALCVLDGGPLAP